MKLFEPFERLGKFGKNVLKGLADPNTDSQLSEARKLEKKLKEKMREY